MSIWLILLIAEALSGWFGFQIGYVRGMERMENKRGRRRAQ